MSKHNYIYFASSNKDKLKEIKDILNDIGFKRLINKIKLAPHGFSVNENASTFLGNAYKKAKTLSKKLKVYSFSDDSGFEVYALNKKPGLKSARLFNNGKGMIEIAKTMRSKKNKNCRFACAIVLTDPKGEILFKTTKYWYGLVADKPLGNNGFGYDPIFLIPHLNKTSAQLSSRLKNKISHRSMAITEIKKWMIKNNFLS